MVFSDGKVYAVYVAWDARGDWFVGVRVWSGYSCGFWLWGWMVWGVMGYLMVWWMGVCGEWRCLWGCGFNGGLVVCR